MLLDLLEAIYNDAIQLWYQYWLHIEIMPIGYLRIAIANQWAGSLRTILFPWNTDQNYVWLKQVR